MRSGTPLAFVVLSSLIVAAPGCATPDAPAVSERDTPRYLIRDPGRDDPAGSGSAPAGQAAGPSAGADLGKGPLTLGRALAIVEERNPALSALEREVAAARGRELQAGLLPNPTLSLDSVEGPLYRGFGRSINTAEVSYAFPVGGRIGAAEAAAAKARETAEANLALARRMVRADLRAAFATGLAWQARRGLTEEMIGLARRSRQIVATRLNAGDAPQGELLRAEVDLECLLLDGAQVESELIGARRRLGAILGQPGMPVPELAGELATATADIALPEIRERVMRDYPTIQALTQSWEEARLDLLLAQRERIPDVTVSVAGGSSPEVRATDDFIIQAGVSVPIPLFNRNQGRIAEAEANIGRAARVAEAGVNEVLLELAEDHRQFTIARERVRRYREEILPRADLSLQQARAAYEAGKLRLLDVLDAQRTLGEARGLYLDALRDMAVSRAEIDKFIGE